MFNVLLYVMPSGHVCDILVHFPKNGPIGVQIFG